MDDLNEKGSQSEETVPPRTKSQPKKSKGKRLWKAFKIFSLLFVTVSVIGGGATAGYVASLVKKAPEFDLNTITNMAATTKVYDKDRQFMFELQGDGDRELIKSLDQTSPFVYQAFIAAEDKDFYNHIGVNPYALARAVVQNVIGRQIVSGASTITQQTIKNAMFPDQAQTVERKVQEMSLAIELEQSLTKDEILTTYLNWIYFGKSGPDNLYGIERASKAIFGIPSKDLNLAQATILAALPNNPSLFNPYDKLEATLERQEYILREMIDAGYITEAQYQEAKAYDVAKDINEYKAKKAIRAGEFAHLNAEVETRAAERLMETGNYESLDQARQALFRGGYSVHTTIDRKKQTIVNQVIDNPKFYPANINYSFTDKAGKNVKVENALEQAGATLIDNKTGRILAMGGGRDYETDQVNHATQPRQPGSTMKPIAVFGPAIDLKQLGSGTAIDDVPMVWPDQSAADGKYFPFNWDKKFHGLMTARHALEQSYNIPALKVFQQIKPQVGLDYLRKMGVTTLENSDNNLAAGIGGLTYGLTVEETTNSFATIPSGGVFHDAYMIDEIVDRDGNTIYKHEDKPVQVFNANTAYILNDMLTGVVKRGTASEVGAKFSGYAIAGKTGTTNEDKDAWFVGYTPDVTLGIWVGYNIPYPLNRGEGNLPKKLWSNIMADVLPTIENRTREFPKNPGGVRQVTVCKLSGKIPTELCQAEHTTSSEMFIAGAAPTKECDVHVKTKYYEVGGKKYLADDSTPAYLVKEGIFIKRDKYQLPNNNTAYRPLDFDKELPSDKNPRGGDETLKTTKVPSGLSVTSTTASSITLSWTPVEGAKGYLILRANSEAGPFEIQTELKGTGTTYTDSSVTAGRTYAYQVVSLDSTGMHSNPSGIVKATPGRSELVPPSNLSISQSAVGVTISWSSVNGATSYNVYRSPDANSGFQKVGTASGTSYQDIGALPGTTFYYKVTALSGNEESAASGKVSTEGAGGDAGQPDQNPPVSAPSSVSIANPSTGNSLIVSWSAVDNATNYVIERSTTGQSWSEVGRTSSTSYNDAGLIVGQKYYYRIRTVQGERTSQPSQIASATPMI